MPIGQDAPPPSPDEAEKALNRWPADLAGLRVEWSNMKGGWDQTVSWAQTLGEQACRERVNNEWSFIETLRHLVFVTDAWIGRVVLCEQAPYHRESLPPTFLPDLSFLGIDTTVELSMDAAISLRADSQATVDDLLTSLDDDGLLRLCDVNPARGFPPDTTHTVLRCVQVVLNEESAHHAFARRDLAAIEARS